MNTGEWIFAGIAIVLAVILLAGIFLAIVSEYTEQ